MSGMCSICGQPLHAHRLPNGEIYWKDGHNAAPLAEGRACDSCNGLVIAHRMGAPKAECLAQAHFLRVQHDLMSGWEQ